MIRAYGFCLLALTAIIFVLSNGIAQTVAQSRTNNNLPKLSQLVKSENKPATPSKQYSRTSEATSTIQYVGDLSSIFPNPERGWHNRRSVDARKTGKEIIFDNIKASGQTLIHSYLHLDDYRDTDTIPQSYLKIVQEALDSVRAAGLKIILRPVHVWTEIPDVAESRILKHIEQINAVISANADVVCHLEAGYLGKWGEWHTGRYTELSNRKDGDTRYRIIKRILETTPNSIPLVMRYPMHIREILDELPVPAGSKPLTQQERDRLGHHNDCFLYDQTDRGTYSRMKPWFGDQTLAQQKEYAHNLQTSYGGDKMVGGETCSPAMGRIDETQLEMAVSNWTELNLDFWRDAIDMWKKHQMPATGNDPAESEFDRISRKLGYRLRLLDATFAPMVKAGQEFTFSAHLNNDGYAGVVKSRPVYLVFLNEGHRYDVKLNNVDVRTWLSGPVVLSNQSVQLPSTMIAGKYQLALWLPDEASNLHQIPSYSIRLANTGIWDSQRGLNLLSNSVVVR